MSAIHIYIFNDVTCYYKIIVFNVRPTLLKKYITPGLILRFSKFHSARISPLVTMRLCGMHTWLT